MTPTQVRNVMVVDDVADERAELRSQLLRGSDARHVFTDAASGAEALRLLTQRGPAAFDCVLLDFNLPDMDAPEVLARLCQPLGRAPCPVLVVTGTHHQDGRALIRAGAQDYIGKSWTTPHSLARAVENAIERFAMQQESLRGQEALALESARLALALTAGQMGVYELDLTDGMLSWSPEVYALFGLAPDTFTPTRAGFRTLVHPQDRTLPWQAVHDTSLPAPMTTQEYRIQRPDGQWRWMAQRGQTTPDASGSHLRHAGVVFDITDRKRAEEQQAQCDQRLHELQFYTRSLIEAHSDALVVTDPAGTVTDVNHQMQALTGSTRAELIGVPFASLFSQPGRASEGLALALARRHLHEHELVLLSRDGSGTQVSLNASTFYDRQRELQGVFFSARDVTQRRFLDTALQETHVALETARFLAQQASQRKSALLLRMAQAMEAPLALIGEQARQLQADPPLSAMGRALAAERIQCACDELLQQVQQSAGLAGVPGGEAGQAPPPRVTVGVQPPT